MVKNDGCGYFTGWLPIFWETLLPIIFWETSQLTESLSGKNFCLDGFFPGRNFLMKGLSNIAATGSYTWRRARGDFNGEIGSLLGDISTLLGVVDEGVGTGDRTAV